MNKIMISTALMTLLMVSGALALEPCPLAMKFVTSPPGANAGLNLQVSYGTLSATAVTNEFGEAMVDMGHLGIADCLVQDFEVIVTECADDTICHKTVSFNPNGFTTLDISGASLFECPACICVDETPYSQCDSCCIPTDCEATGFINPEDCPVQEQPDYTAEFFVTAIVALIAGLGVGKYGLGVKIYTNTKGEVVKQHKHKNVVGYHDPKIIHRSQPHKKGELTPKYSDEKDAEGKYKYVGS